MKNRLAAPKKSGAPRAQPGEALPAVVQACCEALRLSAGDLLAWAVHPGEVVLVLNSGIKVRMAADTARAG